jgi:hypothetical protein
MDSRSSSPETPETPETSDGPCNVAIHNDRELPSWYHALHLGKNVSVVGAPDGDVPLVTLQKPEVERMLQLDDLIEEHAYDEYAYTIPSSSFNLSPTCVILPALHARVSQPLPCFYSPSQMPHILDQLCLLMDIGHHRK